MTDISDKTQTDTAATGPRRMGWPASVRERQIETALCALLRLIDSTPWRDGAGLRLGPGVPHYDDAKEALGDG